MAAPANCRNLEDRALTVEQLAPSDGSNADFSVDLNHPEPRFFLKCHNPPSFFFLCFSVELIDILVF